MEVNESLRTLRATRRFADRRIPDPLVERWLESARWCGSSRNSQPWRFLVVRDPQLRRQLSTLGDDASHLASASLVVALASVPGPYPFSTTFDLGRVAQSLMLAAHADGVGSCIAVFEPAEKVSVARDLLEVPSELTLDLAIGFGYPQQVPTQPRDPAGRLELELLVREVPPSQES